MLIFLNILKIEFIDRRNFKREEVCISTQQYCFNSKQSYFIFKYTNTTKCSENAFQQEPVSSV